MPVSNLLLKIFKQTEFNHNFELKIAELHKQGKIKVPIYLSLGTEHIPPSIAAAYDDWIIFPQHRCHSYYLTFGGDPDLLEKELLEQTDGCNGGMGGSASISIKGRMFGHDGLLGSNHAIASAYALASGRRTIAIIGDAAAEEDAVLSSLGFAASRKSPLLTICEDNNLSITTPTHKRRSWSITAVAKAFGLEAIDIVDDPMLICETVKNTSLPALINIKCCRVLWHAGSGQDSEPKWNRYEMLKDEIKNQNCNNI